MTSSHRPLNVLDVASKRPRSNVCAFPAQPSSASEARHFVRDCLSNAGIPVTLIDRLELTVSELVTNSVLHASAGPTVALHTNQAGLRLEVRDLSNTVPVVTEYGEGAVTGRGLNVVSSAASRWGVDSNQFGKTVWAEFDLTNDEEDFGSYSAPVNHADIVVEEELSADARTVEFNQVPVQLFLELEQCNDAVLREFELLFIQMANDDSEQVFDERQMSAIVARSTQYFNATKHRLRNAVRRANDRNQEFVDLRHEVDSRTMDYAMELNSLIAQADSLSDQGVLLTASAPYRVRQLRLWFVDEMRNQFENGRPPIAFRP